MKATHKWLGSFAALGALAVPIAACGGGSSTDPSEEVITGDVADELQSIVEAAVDNPDAHFPGAMLHVSSPELGTWSGAAGLANVETDTAMQPDTKVRGGSLLKPFVAAVILQLVEEGELTLDDPLTDVLPDSITTRFSNSDQVTVRHLLNHTSGLADWLTGDTVAAIAADPARVWEADELFDISAAQGPDFAPGEGFTYSNTGYNLLGAVIEEATGSPWRAEVRERVIEPLQLDDTSLPEPGDQAIPDDHAQGYQFIDGEVVPIITDSSMGGASGGDALETTGPDLIRFLDALRAGDLFSEDATLTEMNTFVDVPTDEGPPYAYGLALERYELDGGVAIEGKDGGAVGFNNLVTHWPEHGITVEATVNTGIAEEMLNVYFDIVVPALQTVAAAQG